MRSSISKVAERGIPETSNNIPRCIVVCNKFTYQQGGKHDTNFDIAKKWVFLRTDTGFQIASPKKKL